MISNELSINLTNQVRRIHKHGGRVVTAREKRSRLEGRLAFFASLADPENAFLSLTAALMVALLWVVDASIVAPILIDRFNLFQYPHWMQWTAAFGISTLLMAFEAGVATMGFEAYKRALDSRRYVLLTIWVAIGLGFLIVTILFGYSQLAVVASRHLWQDSARASKELGLLLLFSFSHATLLLMGRYLPEAKKAVAQWSAALVAKLLLRDAKTDEQKAHADLMDEYRVHLAAVTRAHQQGHQVPLGPFERHAEELIRERHEDVDARIREFGGLSVGQAVGRGEGN